MRTVALKRLDFPFITTGIMAVVIFNIPKPSKADDDCGTYQPPPSFRTFAKPPVSQYLVRCFFAFIVHSHTNLVLKTLGSLKFTITKLMPHDFARYVLKSFSGVNGLDKCANELLRAITRTRQSDVRYYATIRRLTVFNGSTYTPYAYTIYTV